MSPAGIERDPILGELRARDDAARDLYARYVEALMFRDGMVHDLMTGEHGVCRGPTQIAHAIRVDRTWPYGIRRQWPSRLADWVREHPGWTHRTTTRTSTPNREI